jgi:hypothetical protein
MERTNIGSMDIFADLIRQARADRRNDIAAARQRYANAVDQINRLRATMGRKAPARPMEARRVRRYSADTPIHKLPLLAAAERILVERGALSIVELVVELQQRGCRADDSPHRVKKTVTSAMYYHKYRFARDGAGRWTVI